MNMAHLGFNGILPFIFVLSCIPAFPAELVVQEGSSLQIKEGTTLTITCLTNTTANIDFLFNSSIIGSCIHLLGKCTTNDKFIFTANVSMQPYQYGLTSKIGVDTSFCGTYFCRDVPNTFRDSINVSVTAFANNTHEFVEEENTVCLTTSCISHVTKDDLQVEWFIDDNITVTKLNLSLVEDMVQQFTTENNCTTCGGSESRNITTGLNFKTSTKVLAYVYLELQLSYTNFTTRERTNSTYPLKVVEGGQETFEKGLKTSYKALIAICVIIFLAILLLIVWIFCLKNGQFKIWYCVAAIFLIPLLCLILHHLFLRKKENKKVLCWKPLLDGREDQSCIAGCQQKLNICEIDNSFRNQWFKHYKKNTCNKWNKSYMGYWEKVFPKAYIKQLWEDKNVRSKALKCYFDKATENDKTTIFNKFLNILKEEKQTADVMKDWLLLGESQQNEFLPSLGQCTKIITLLWLNLELSLKFKLFMRFWTSFSSNIQNKICEIIFTSKNAKQEITHRITRFINGTDNTLPFVNEVKGHGEEIKTNEEKGHDEEIKTNEEKGHDEEIKTVKQLKSFLSKYQAGQLSQIFEDFDQIKDDHGKFDKLFIKLSKDLQLKMMEETDKSRRVFVTSGFWQKLSDYQMDIPFDEVCCVGKFISSRTKYNSTIRWVEGMGWKKITGVLTSSEIFNIFLHLDWTDIPEAICHQWMNEQWTKDIIQCGDNRHLITSEQNETVLGTTIACKGEATKTGITSIQLYFDVLSCTEEPSIAATIKSSTSKPLCTDHAFNDVILKLLEKVDLAIYLRRMPGLKDTAETADLSTESARRDILKVFTGDDITVVFHERKEEGPI